MHAAWHSLEIRAEARNAWEIHRLGCKPVRTDRAIRAANVAKSAASRAGFFSGNRDKSRAGSRVS
jgi:hypothetical protein